MMTTSALLVAALAIAQTAGPCEPPLSDCEVSLYRAVQKEEVMHKLCRGNLQGCEMQAVVRTSSVTKSRGPAPSSSGWILSGVLGSIIVGLVTFCVGFGVGFGAR